MDRLFLSSTESHLGAAPFPERIDSRMDVSFGTRCGGMRGAEGVSPSHHSTTTAPRGILLSHEHAVGCVTRGRETHASPSEGKRRSFSDCGGLSREDIHRAGGRIRWPTRNTSTASLGTGRSDLRPQKLAASSERSPR